MGFDLSANTLSGRGYYKGVNGAGISGAHLKILASYKWMNITYEKRSFAYTYMFTSNPGELITALQLAYAILPDGTIKYAILPDGTIKKED